MRLEDATVLVVDDEKELREIFSAWLGRKGCKVLTAANGVEALKVLETEKVDVLVSDIRMPIMGGVALVRAIYEKRLLIPSIIFVSGYGDVEPREMYGLGVEVLMEKPLSRKDLIRALDDSLMDRDQLWLTPSPMPMEQTLSLEIESFNDAMATCHFQLGRGGCCIYAGRPLEEKSIDLCIRFAREGLCLKAQGTVRWYEKETAHAGVSFSYLAAECREWMLAAMQEAAYRSFIPQCRWQPRQAASAQDAAGSLPQPDPVPQHVT
jgi:CheY-like chemotaxis protein